MEACYLLASPADRGSGAASRLSRGHSRAPSAASAASWDSSALGGAQPQLGGRAGGAAEGSSHGGYVEASVSRMLSAGRDRWVRLAWGRVEELGCSVPSLGFPHTSSLCPLQQMTTLY